MAKIKNDVYIWLIGLLIFCSIPMGMVIASGVLCFLGNPNWYWFLLSGVIVSLGVRVHYADMNVDDEEDGEDTNVSGN